MIMLEVRYILYINLCAINVERFVESPEHCVGMIGELLIEIVLVTVELVHKSAGGHAYE